MAEACLAGIMVFNNENTIAIKVIITTVRPGILNVAVAVSSLKS